MHESLEKAATTKIKHAIKMAYKINTNAATQAPIIRHQQLPLRLSPRDSWSHASAGHGHIIGYVGCSLSPGPQSFPAINQSPQ